MKSIKLLILFIFILLNATSQIRIKLDGEFVQPDSVMLAKINIVKHWIEKTTVLIPIKFFHATIEADTSYSLAVFKPIADTFNKRWVYFRLKDFFIPKMITTSSNQRYLVFDFNIGKVERYSQMVDKDKYKNIRNLLSSTQTFLDDTSHRQNVISTITSLISLSFDFDDYRKIELIVSMITNSISFQYTYFWENEMRIKEHYGTPRACCSGWTDFIVHSDIFKLHNLNLRPNIELVSSYSDRYSKLSYREFDDSAEVFLNYIAKQINPKSKIGTVTVLNNPPRIKLDKVKGFITGPKNYWESVEIKIERFNRYDDKSIIISCSTNGFFHAIDTESITDDKFYRKVSLLEFEYKDQLETKNQEIIKYFKNRIKY